MDKETNNFETKNPRLSKSNNKSLGPSGIEGASQNYSQNTSGNLIDTSNVQVPKSQSPKVLTDPLLNQKTTNSIANQRYANPIKNNWGVAISNGGGVSRNEPISEINNQFFDSKGLDKAKRNTEKPRSSWPLDMGQKTNRQDIVSITYEEIGFFPRSFSRVFDRFLKQVFSDVENLVIQEYRFYRYLFLTTLKCLLILFFVPFIVNYLSKAYLVSPLTEYFWNTQQTEIFLNSYQQKRAFTELKDFEEKLYFESLLNSGSKTNRLEEVSGLTKSKKANLLLQQETSDVNFLSKTALPYLSPNLINGLGAPTVSNITAPLMPEDHRQDLKTMSTVGIVSLREPNQQLGINVSAIPENQQSLLLLQSTSIDNQFEISNNLADGKTVLQVSQTEGRPLKNLSAMPEDGKVKTTIGERSLVLEMAEGHRQAIDNATPTPSKNNGGWLQKSTRQEIFEQRLQEKTIELAIRYNNQSIEAITNFFADLISFITLCYLLVVLEIQINITKSFLLEVFFGLDDGKKSLLILLITDLLVGYHSSNLWELFFEFLFNHYGLPESQTGIFLLVATLPVLLDVLFKYLIFRHLNRSSPATVATYHAIIE